MWLAPVFAFPASLERERCVRHGLAQDALELLAEKREPVVLGAITARYGHDTGPSSALLAALRDSVKAVELPDGKFMYKVRTFRTS